MSTDDRDIESSNPSKNFKVGDFDQLSGFFTPVWESKRKIRSEPPAPPSSKGSSSNAAASSRSGAPASTPPSAKPNAQGPKPNAQGPKPSAEETAELTNLSKGAGVPRPRTSTGGKARSSAPRAPTPVPPAPNSDRAGATSVPLPPAVAEVFGAPAIGYTVAASPPVEPEAAPRREAVAADAQPAAPASASPSAAARALRDAGPNLPPAAFLDQEPEFRTPAPRPARTDRAAAQHRAQRASTAAARVHEQLKAKYQAEAAEIDESRFDLDPETHRDPLQAEAAEYDPFPLSLMRRLRRTIRLSAPVPDAVRSMISKYDRS